MTSTETATPTIAQALSRAMREVRGVDKGQRNQQQNFCFRGIDDVLNALGPALRNHGIVPAPQILHSDVQVDQNPNGKRQRWAVLTVQYTFHGPAGDSLATVVLGEAMDYGDKVVSKAMSVAYRTALIQTFALPTEEADPDSYVYDINGEDPAPAQQPHRQQQSAPAPATEQAPEPAQPSADETLTVGGYDWGENVASISNASDFSTYLEIARSLGPEALKALGTAITNRFGREHAFRAQVLQAYTELTGAGGSAAA